MDFKVLITETAVADLKEIVEFVAQDNPNAAISLGEKPVDRALALTSMPQRFSFHDRQRGISQNAVAAFFDFLHV
jgi:plasmid stabilization system protein ParE